MADHSDGPLRQLAQKPAKHARPDQVIYTPLAQIANSALPASGDGCVLFVEQNLERDEVGCFVEADYASGNTVLFVIAEQHNLAEGDF
jgi:hypothetical protein